ncbi:MAG: ABC transporter permease [Saccharofermentans sp.]|nr:ABC transporter permease [Saccharofermentans sp.]
MRNTKIIHAVTLKHMKMNKKRTVISIVGIALMVMLLTCVLIGKDTAYRYFVDLTAVQKGYYHFAVYNIDKEKLDEIKDLDIVKEVGVTEDLKYTEFDKTGNPAKPFLNIRRYSEEAMDWMNIKVVEGRLPQNGDEIVISESAIEDGSAVKIGDTIDCETFQRYMSCTAEGVSTVFQYPMFEIPAGETVEVPYNMFYFVPGTEEGDKFYETHDEIHEPTGFAGKYTVVGIIETPVFEEPGCAWYAAISKVDEDTLASTTFNALLMTDENKITPEFYYTLREMVGYENYYSNDGILVFAGGSSENSLNKIVRAMQAFFIVLIALISVMLIYNVFALSYDERARYLGMLSSVGATGKQKRSSVYFEAMVLLLPSLPIGFAAGLVVVKIAANIAGPMAQKLYRFSSSGLPGFSPALEVKPAAVIAVILLSVVTVFISALIPAHKISKVGPIESIRGNKSASKSRHKAGRNPDKYVSGSAVRMLSSRFLKNDKSKSGGIIRAVAIFFIVTVVVYFGASLLIMMVNYKLRDNSLVFSYYSDRDYYLTMHGSNERLDPDEFIAGLRTMDGTSDIVVCKREMFGLQVDHDTLSDEYWDDLYEIVCMYYPEGELSREDFNSMYRSDDPDVRESIGVLAFDDEDFEKMAKDLNALSYGEDDMPCILVTSAAVSTEMHSVFGQELRDFKYLEINDPFTPQPGDDINVYPYALTRAEAAEYDIDESEYEFPEIELDGPASFKVIGKAGAEDLSGYLEGAGDMNLYIIVPMSVAGYIDKINSTPLNTEVFFNCDNEETMKTLALVTEQLSGQGESIYLFSTDSGTAGMKETLAFLIRTVLIVFTLISSAICLLNVYSSISALMVSRRKNFAMLKSMGSTFGQLIITELRESAGMLIRSFLIALPVTAAVCYLLSKFLIRTFGYFTIGFPVAATLILIGFIVVAVLLMVICCLKRENKIDIIEEIKRESV